MTRKMLLAVLLGLSSCDKPAPPPLPGPVSTRTDKVELSEEQWKARLTPEQYHILREKGTETAFTGKDWNNHQAGIYHCAGCDLELFDSSTKFDSGTGWPSYYQPIAPTVVVVGDDRSLGITRSEVTCARCGGHLGHVFDDGPKPTGLRYCMNSGALKFVAK